MTPAMCSASEPRRTRRRWWGTPSGIPSRTPPDLHCTSWSSCSPRSRWSWRRSSSAKRRLVRAPRPAGGLHRSDPGTHRVHSGQLLGTPDRCAAPAWLERPIHQLQWLRRDAPYGHPGRPAHLLLARSRSPARRLAGLNREAAARFSFLMATPIIAGAGIWKARELLGGGLPGADLLPLAAGFATALVAGLLAIAFLLAFLRRRSTALFIGYRYALAA